MFSEVVIFFTAFVKLPEKLLNECCMKIDKNILFVNTV